MPRFKNPYKLLVRSGQKHPLISPLPRFQHAIRTNWLVQDLSNQYEDVYTTTMLTEPPIPISLDGALLALNADHEAFLLLREVVALRREFVVEQRLRSFYSDSTSFLTVSVKCMECIARS